MKNSKDGLINPNETKKDGDIISPDKKKKDDKSIQPKKKKITWTN